MLRLIPLIPAWISILILLFLASCGEDALNAVTPNLGGAQEIAFSLPFAEGSSRQCVQGANGAFSHQGRSTKYDLDIDTSNTAQEELFAPIGGTAYVHDDPKGFGTHVNIDLADGTYAVLAHLSKVFVEPGQEVSKGQLIGYEGCTGLCTGDHVHIGRHKGDASQPADRGESIPFLMQAANGLKSSSEWPCSLSTKERMVSDLSVALSHPDGSLVKLPSSNKVYRIDEGRLRWMASEEVFRSYDYRMRDVLLIS